MINPQVYKMSEAMKNVHHKVLQTASVSSILFYTDQHQYWLFFYQSTNQLLE